MFQPSRQPPERDLFPQPADLTAGSGAPAGFRRADSVPATVETVLAALADRYGEDWDWERLTGGEAFLQELRRETGPGHPLAELDLRPVARCTSRDDVLFAAGDRGPWYQVHLTWSGKHQPGRPGFVEYTDLTRLSAAWEQDFLTR